MKIAREVPPYLHVALHGEWPEISAGSIILRKEKQDTVWNSPPSPLDAAGAASASGEAAAVVEIRQVQYPSDAHRQRAEKGEAVNGKVHSVTQETSGKC